MKVTTAEFLKNFGTLADKALKEPITITKHGKDRFVLVEAGEYEHMRKRWRRAYVAGELPDYIFEQLKNVKMDPKYDDLNEELKDWKP